MKKSKSPKIPNPLKADPKPRNPDGPPYVGQQRREIVSYGGSIGFKAEAKAGTVVAVTKKGLYRMEFEYHWAGQTRILHESYVYVSPDRLCTVADAPRFRSNSGYKKFKYKRFKEEGEG